MPYIRNGDRAAINNQINNVASTILVNFGGASLPGAVNYTVSRLLKQVYGAPLTYADYNEIIGVLECCKLEFYRAQVAPYEDEKRKENGPV